MSPVPQQLVQALKPIVPAALWGWLRRHTVERRLPPVVRAVQGDRLSFLGERALAELHAAVKGIEASGLPGVLVEAGCALGGSALVMADSKAAARTLRIYDVFGFPPPPSENDGPDVHARWDEIASGRSRGIAGNLYYGYRGDLLASVIAAFRRYGFDPDAQRIEFVQGLLQETLRLDGPVALAHIDCDRYASVKTCLDRIGPRLPQGGVMVVDDYESKSGCRRAVDEFLAENPGFETASQARLHIRRL